MYQPAKVRKKVRTLKEFFANVRKSPCDVLFFQDMLLLLQFICIFVPNVSVKKVW